MSRAAFHFCLRFKTMDSRKRPDLCHNRSLAQVEIRMRHSVAMSPL
jgi:hypothetical protein